MMPPAAVGHRRTVPVYATRLSHAMKIVLPLLFSLTTLTAAAAIRAAVPSPKPPHELSAEMKAAFESCKEHGKPGSRNLTTACQIWDLSGGRPGTGRWEAGENEAR